jgi:hypothetical protein
MKIYHRDTEARRKSRNGCRSLEIRADLNDTKMNPISDQRSSALICGNIIYCSPCLRASVVELS